MHADRPPTPPRLAVALLRLRLPRELAEAIIGDLEEEYRTRVMPASGPLQAGLWFWGQALTVRGGALRRANRGLRSTRPTWERNRPRHAGDGDPDPLHWFHMLLRDLTYAIRRLARSPGFTLTAILSLALGIGANTAMFSLVNAVLLRGPPVQDPEALVEVYTTDSSGYEYGTSSYLDYADLKERTDLFDGGVVSYAVSKRTRELGIRMALGASAGDVVRMAVGGGMRLVVVGGVLGVILAAAVTWSISGFLYGIGSADLATFGAIPLILAGVALLAAFIPARRASTVDPVQALRTD